MKAYILTFLTCILFEYVATDIIVYMRNTGQIMEEFRDLPARFGPSFPQSGARYLHVPGQPINGCGQMEKAPMANGTKFAVFIARYNCSFEIKIRNAQSAGFDAVIVYNVGSNELEEMSVQSPDGIIIPSAFVSEQTGRVLIGSYSDYTEYAIIINDDLPFNINTHLIIPFSIVVCLCFITMIGFMFIKCYRERQRMQRYRLPSNLLKKIPTVKFAKGDIYEMCAICLDEYAEGDKLRVLPCAHAYHTKCIDPWLTKNRRVCPICKRKVFARGEQRPRRRRSSSDSMSDSDDDRTPLLRNPTSESNVTNHGTFGGSRDMVRDGAPETSNQESDGHQNSFQPAPRINPFDRSPAMTASQSSDGDSLTESSRWARIKSLFTWRANALQHPANDDDDAPTSVLVQTEANVAASTPINVALPIATSSNNLLNKNLSGSFKDNADSDSNEDDLNQTDNQKVNASTVNVNTAAAAVVAPHERLGVAAIPNPSFNPQPSNSQKRNNTHYNI